MDRELVLAVLVVFLCGSTLTAAGWYPSGATEALSVRALERRTWQRLWLPFVPALLLLAALCGWASVEPEQSERVPSFLIVGALPFAALLLHAGGRALLSLRRVDQDQAMATIGLLRPRIVVSPEVVKTLDARALAAGLEHERAHARHRDPLRIWLAHFGTDLLLPWPVAASRLLCWRRALELARDEEARLAGVAGADLAAAVLAALRIGQKGAWSSVATLGGDTAFLEERIARLMEPIDPRSETPRRAFWPLAVIVGITSASFLGAHFGERVVSGFLALV